MLIDFFIVLENENYEVVNREGEMTNNDEVVLSFLVEYTTLTRSRHVAKSDFSCRYLLFASFSVILQNTEKKSGCSMKIYHTIASLPD